MVYGGNMRIIHCGDIHLDSKLKSKLDSNKAMIRNHEILDTFIEMVDYAKTNMVSAIIISGDLFDNTRISVFARKAVFNKIENSPSVNFYYLCGNHDKKNFTDNIEYIPDNLYLFSDKWQYYRIGDNEDIVISGVEIYEMTDSLALSRQLKLMSEDINIVVMHGTIIMTNANKKDEINIRNYANKNIDYMALGHYHSYTTGNIDARGIYCYSGCLEGRGFDECGEHGFVLLDIDEEHKRINHEFIPFAKRMIEEIKIDLSGIDAYDEIIGTIENTIDTINCDNMVRIRLVGQIDMYNEININSIMSKYASRYFYFEIINDTTYRIDYNRYLNEDSLKGEFVRLVVNSPLSEEEISDVLRCGIMTLSGEEVQINEDY